MIASKLQGKRNERRRDSGREEKERKETEVTENRSHCQDKAIRPSRMWDKVIIEWRDGKHEGNTRN